MQNSLVILFAALLLAGLLHFEKKNDAKGILPVKTTLSVLFIVAAWVQPHWMALYAPFVVIGLVCCLGGDVFLALPHKRMFLFGLVSFLIGHVFYVAAFVLISDINGFTAIGVLQTLTCGTLIYRWLRPHLGDMKVPVLVYIVVISVMLCGAWSILGSPDLAGSGKVMVFVGALSFYLSDILVARDRFLKTEFLNRLVGLPLYYAGQFLIAFSTGFMT